MYFVFEVTIQLPRGLWTRKKGDVEQIPTRGRGKPKVGQIPKYRRCTPETCMTCDYVLWSPAKEERPIRVSTLVSDSELPKSVPDQDKFSILVGDLFGLHDCFCIGDEFFGQAAKGRLHRIDMESIVKANGGKPVTFELM